MTHVPDARSGGRPDGLRARKRSIRWLSAPSLGSNFSVAIVYLLEKVQTSGVSEPEKNRPMAVVHALWTAVFLWVGWFISGYGTPLSKTVQPHDYIGEKLPNRSLYKRVSSKIPSLFLPFRNCRTFLCSHCRTGSSRVEASLFSRLLPADSQEMLPTSPGERK